MDLTNLNRDKKQRKHSLDVSTMVYGKVPPQAKHLEEAVLGAIMLEKDKFDAVAELLSPESFYVDAHNRIYKAMQSLSSRSQPIDMLTVVEELRSREELDLVGGPFYVTKLTDRVAQTANVESYARIIVEKHVKRRIIDLSGNLLQMAYEDSSDAFELLDFSEESLSNISQSFSGGEMIGIDTVLVEAVLKIEEWRTQDSSITGVPSGFKDLDKATRGWQNGDLIIIAARPSVGKTALALNIIRNAAEQGTSLQNSNW